MSYTWEQEFEEKFAKLLKQNDTEKTKVIIGQEPYKYKLNNKNFYVKSLKYPYKDIDKAVAFLVTDWIKIQDSLEMIFNLLFNGNVNSLNVLSFLREKEVKADEFADYLFVKYRLILTNKKGVDGKSNVEKINGILEKEKESYLLLVGSEIAKIKSFKGNIKKRIEFIHPSGSNISLAPEKYYLFWYKYDNKPQDIEAFRIFN